VSHGAARPEATPEITIAQLHAEKPFREAVALQKTIWGFDDIELLPVRLFVVADKIGGHAFGAFDKRRMIAFCLAIPGLKPGGKSYLHGHMLGVLPEYRNLGIGRTLKLRQREEAIGRGIDLIEWTFDPLEIRNAWFNMERLGAIVRRYVRNQYGTTSSHLHGGLPTDRCIAEWHLRSDRVEAAIAGRPVPRPEIAERIDLPADIAEIRRDHPERARAIQSNAADRFEECFAQNLAVVGIEKTAVHGAYLFGKLP
jgi:predicted GNAT superfamily acetyltransferase